MSSSRLAPAEGEFLAVDYGLKRVGLARINSHARIAEYLPVMQRDNDQQVIDELINIAESLGAHGIVVGLPRTLDGGESEQTKLTRDFIDALYQEVAGRYEVYAIDEAGTSEEAKERAGALTTGVDSVAAGIMAEDFIAQADVLKLKIKG